MLVIESYALEYAMLFRMNDLALIPSIVSKKAVALSATVHIKPHSLLPSPRRSESRPRISYFGIWGTRQGHWDLVAELRER